MADDGTYFDLACAILVAHQRRADSNCLCGGLDLGDSWAAHVAWLLETAGALRDGPPGTQDADAPTRDGLDRAVRAASSAHEEVAAITRIARRNARRHDLGTVERAALDDITGRATRAGDELRATGMILHRNPEDDR